MAVTVTQVMEMLALQLNLQQIQMVDLVVAEQMVLDLMGMRELVAHMVILV